MVAAKVRVTANRLVLVGGGTRVVRGGVYQGWGTGWVPGGYYPSTTLPGTLYWYCQGPTTAPSPHYRVPGHSRLPPGALRTPSSRTRRYALLEPIKARFRYIYLKVSQNLECHRKSFMRPAILPISKTGLEITTLNFQISVYAQPSLTRNKWSRI